ncbi:MAG: sugar ABC transporter permease [Lachnospiraceae bacterium]|nr:sugar ABC transporter permease [Lachnospiraceae bacterium]
MKIRNKTKIWIFAFLFPSILLYALVYVYPLATDFITSFCKWTSKTGPKFSGLSNYMYLFSRDSNLLVAFKNTALWIVLQCTIHVGLGFLVAFVLARRPFGWKFTRTAYMIPNAVSSVAMGVLYLNMFNPQIGIVNSLIRKLGFTDFQVNWFANDATAFFAVTMTWLPYAAMTTILVMAEMTAIPDSLREAAKIDGASNLQVDLHIVLPMLKNVFNLCLILAASAMVTNFDNIFVTTRGGPNNATLNLGLYYYKTANIENNYGLANAIGTIQIVFGLVLIWVINKVVKVDKE